MKRSAALDALPAPVQRALTKLGEDIGAARRRRWITMAIIAERAFITRKTLARVERGARRARRSGRLDRDLRDGPVRTGHGRSPG